MLNSCVALVLATITRCGIFGTSENPADRLDQFASMRAGVNEIVLLRMDDRLWQPVDRTPGLNLVKFVTADPARLGKLWPDREGDP